MRSLEGRNVVVLGAGRGLGAMIAERAAASGAKSIAVSRTLRAAPGRALERLDLLLLDAADENAPARVFNTLEPSLLVVCGGARPFSSSRPPNELGPVFAQLEQRREDVLSVLQGGAHQDACSRLGGHPDLERRGVWRFSHLWWIAGAKRMQMLIANHCQ